MIIEIIEVLFVGTFVSSQEKLRKQFMDYLNRNKTKSFIILEQIGFYNKAKYYIRH